MAFSLVGATHSVEWVALLYLVQIMAEAFTRYKTDDAFYKSKKWIEKRKHILFRDKWTDQYKLKQGVTLEANTVHHILPREEYPEYQWCDWNLISVNENTHRKILHQTFTHDLTKAGKLLMQETAYANGVKLTSLTLIIGMPGTGKSTYAKKHLGTNGMAYELDAIASAFRLTVPHKEESHTGSRRLAARLRQGWLQLAPQFCSHLYVVRTCPDIEELTQTNPDKLVVCRKIHAVRPYEFDKANYQERIDDAVQWAIANGVPIQYVDD